MWVKQAAPSSGQSLTWVCLPLFSLALFGLLLFDGDGYSIINGEPSAHSLGACVVLVGVPEPQLPSQFELPPPQHTVACPPTHHCLPLNTPFPANFCRFRTPGKAHTEAVPHGRGYPQAQAGTQAGGANCTACSWEAMPLATLRP